MLAFFHDVTERKQARGGITDENNAPSNTCCNPATTNGRLIAYEIHDGLAQQLAGAIMQFQTFDHLKDKQAQDGGKGV